MRSCRAQPARIVEPKPDTLPGELDAASRLLNTDLAAYDSVQFPAYNVASWRGVQLTEIIMLRWSSENDFLFQHIWRTGLRCGPPASLRPCTADEPAIAQQAAVCRTRPMSGAVGRLARQVGCDT